MNTSISHLLDHAFAHLNPAEALTEPVTILLGLDEDSLQILSQLRIESVADLALSHFFAVASELTTAVVEGGTPLAEIGRPSHDMVDAAYIEYTLEDLIDQQTDALLGISQKTAKLLAKKFDLYTIRDMAYWQPYQSAKAILQLSLPPALQPGYDPEAPDDLIPQNGAFATDRFYYTRFYLDSFLNKEPGASIEEAGPIAFDEMPDNAGAGLAIGAIVTYEQAWFNEGVALGSLLHSLPLAPGESTNIAVIDRQRSTIASTLESTKEEEVRSNVLIQNRSIQEITNATLNGFQSGTSASLATDRTASESHSNNTSFIGGAGGILGPIIAGQGLSASGGQTSGGTFSSSAATIHTTSESERSLAASASEDINALTQQNASAVRSKWASVVQEVSQEETQSFSSRNVTNYNHMHAMTMQYYEVVQIYKVINQPHTVKKCVFIPYTTLDFFDDDVLFRYRNSLMAFALDSIVPKALSQDTEIKMMGLASDTTYQLTVLNRTGAAGITAGITASETVPDTDIFTGDLQIGRPYHVSGPISLPLDATLTDVEATVDGEERSVSYYNLNGDFEFTVPDTVIASNLTALTVIGASGQTGVKKVSLSFKITTSAFSHKYLITYNKNFDGATLAGASASDVIFIVPDASPADLALCKLHLDAHKHYYTRVVLDQFEPDAWMSILAAYRFGQRPLTEVLTSKPAAITSSYLCFEIKVNKEDRQSWEAWKHEKGFNGADALIETRVPVPSGGVFAEAVLGRYNSAEKLDDTRFWDWQDSPIPNSAFGVPKSELRVPNAELRIANVE
ncbi:MAG: hypothetical protein AB8G77_20510 [Rhodothermales bacterium]